MTEYEIEKIVIVTAYASLGLSIINIVIIMMLAMMIFKGTV